MKLYENITNSLNTNLSEWTNNIEKWDYLIEKLRSTFGDKWIFKIISVIIAGIKDKNTLDCTYTLSDTSLSLCRRTKYARSKSGDINYWEYEINQSEDLIFVFLLFFTWATPRVITILYNKIKNIFNKISKNDFKLLFNSLVITVKQNELKKSNTMEITNFFQTNPLAIEFNYLLSFRLPKEIRDEYIYNQDINNNSIFRTDIIKDKFEFLINKYFKEPNNEKLLNQIKEYYKLFSDFDISNEYLYYRHFYRFRDDSDINGISIDIAKYIMKDPISFPRIIASLAEKACRIYANINVNIIGKTANDKKWFE
jgi:hypothetical protein